VIRRRRTIEAQLADHGRLGVAVLTVAAILLYWAFLQDLPFVDTRGGTLVRAEVRTAASVHSRTPVRVGGTDVGKVERVESSGGGRTSTIVMRITEPGVTVRGDASAQVRYRTLLGGSMYIDLDPGSPSAPELGDRAIPLPRTEVQVEWDEFNGIFAKPVPQGQRRIVKGFADTLADRDALRAFLREGAPALDSFGRSARASRGEHPGELPSLIRNSSRTLRAFSRDRSLDRLIAGAERTMRATARVRDALGQTVALAPGALRSTRTTMTRLDRTLDRLDPLADELMPAARATEPATRRLRPASTALLRMMRHAGPLLETGPRTLRTLRSAAAAGLPFLEALRTTTARINAQILPWLNTYDPETRLETHQMVGPWLSGQNDSYAGFDDNGYYLRAVVGLSPDAPTKPCSIVTVRELFTCPILRGVGPGDGADQARRRR
jgi:ABC-type transporter Mla subunit MlaD